MALENDTPKKSFMLQENDAQTLLIHENLNRKSLP
jgi:hypothetical protein